MSHLPGEYRRLRDAAVVVLGGKCAVCGLDDIRALEIDHVEGRFGEPKKSHLQRKMFRAIIKGTYGGPPLQILCGTDHNIKTYQERLDK